MNNPLKVMIERAFEKSKILLEKPLIVESIRILRSSKMFLEKFVAITKLLNRIINLLDS